MSKYEFTETTSYGDLAQELDLNEGPIEAFVVTQDGQTFDHKDINTSFASVIEEGVVSVNKSLKQKSFDGSNQSRQEIDSAVIGTVEGMIATIVSPPYDPACFAHFMEASEVHDNCVRSKAMDSVGRGYKIKPKYPVRTDVPNDDAEVQDHGISISQEEFNQDCAKITEFIKNSAPCSSFQEVMVEVAQDYEAIGWAAFEVIRFATGKIAKLKRIPAQRVRVLQGNVGYVEITGTVPDSFGRSTPLYQYYQPFGEKIVSKTRDHRFGNQEFRDPYDPELDGELDVIQNTTIEYNLRDKKNGQQIDPTIENFINEAANEIVFIKRPAVGTVYYGHSAIVPARSAILSNIYIHDLNVRFLENDCVPRYVVVVKGKKIDDKFKKKVADYLNSSENRKSTMVIALSDLGQNSNADIEFREIDTGRKEVDFLQTAAANDKRIMLAHQVSPAILGQVESAAIGGGKGRAQTENYKDRVVYPLQRKYAHRLNDVFRLGLGCKYAELEYIPYDIRESEAVARAINLLTTNAVITVNEARAILGYDAYRGGDTPLLRAREGNIMRLEDAVRSAFDGIIDSEENMEEIDGLETE